MVEEKETPEEKQEVASTQEEVSSPRSKYERIMLAAAEASRLNEEVRRKGTKLDHKVTIEALKRVAEGKVKGVIGGKEPEPEAKVPLARLDTAGDMLFMNPPLLADVETTEGEPEVGATED